MFGYLLHNWVVFLLLTKFIKLMCLNAPKKVMCVLSKTRLNIFFTHFNVFETRLNFFSTHLNSVQTRFRLKREKTRFFLSTSIFSKIGSHIVLDH